MENYFENNRNKDLQKMQVNNEQELDYIKQNENYKIQENLDEKFSFVEQIKRAQNGDKYAMANLVEENQGLVWNIARRFLGRGYDKEDIYQIGCMGLIKAIRRFDVDFNVQLSTYAVPYILGEIKKFLRDDGPIKVSRSLKELNVKINELQKEYEKTGKELSLVEMSRVLRVPKEEVVLAIESSLGTESIENAKYNGGKSNRDLTLIETLSTNKDEETIITNKIVLNDMIKKLGDRDKKIILLRFYKDKTQTEVAKILGISQVQVSRLEKKILEGMRKQLVS